MLIDRSECRSALIEHALDNGWDIDTYEKIRKGWNDLVRDIDSDDLGDNFDFNVTDDWYKMVYLTDNVQGHLWVTVDLNTHGVITYHIYDDDTDGNWSTHSPASVVDLISHFVVARRSVDY